MAKKTPMSRILSGIFDVYWKWVLLTLFYILYDYFIVGEPYTWRDLIFKPIEFSVITWMLTYEYYTSNDVEIRQFRNVNFKTRLEDFMSVTRKRNFWRGSLFLLALAIVYVFLRHQFYDEPLKWMSLLWKPIEWEVMVIIFYLLFFGLIKMLNEKAKQKKVRESETKGE